jgi:hypothetical protein
MAQGLHLKLLITPGGFVVAPFPTKWHGGVSWNSRASDLDALRVHAERILLQTVTERVLRAAEGKIDILTRGDAKAYTSIQANNRTPSST